MQDKALEQDRQAGLGELKQEKESSGQSSTDADNYRHQIKRLLEGSKAEKAMREAISNQLKRAKEEIDRLKEHLQAANARVDDLTEEKEKYTTELEVSRYETQLAREQLDILHTDNPIRASELLGLPIITTNTAENAVPTDTEPLDSEVSSPSQQLVLEDENTITEVIDLGSEFRTRKSDRGQRNLCDLLKTASHIREIRYERKKEFPKCRWSGVSQETIGRSHIPDERR